jgi:Asp-tRNA(Asn)/Glu-tRNA(Gln) amidotransferase A subunit family amidase
MDPHPIDLTEAPDVDWHLRQDVFVTQYSDEAANWDDGFNPNVRATYDSALQTPMDAIARARRTQMRLTQRFAAIFEDYDVVIAPGVSVPPFPWKHLNPQTVDGHPVENYMAWLALTASLTVVGHPVVALPCGLDEAGTPFGVQVIGPAFGETDLLSSAIAIEAAFTADPLLARPVPDIPALASAASTTRTEGLEVQTQ